jgi:uncharacterized protein YdbL (DUF1318 family)
MNKRILIRWLMGPSLPHLIVLGLAVWGFVGLTRIGYTAIEKWGNSAPGPTKPAVESTTALLDFVRRPCASVDAAGHLLPDGPICELNQAIHDIRKITTASGKQVQQTGQLIDATARTMGTVGESVKGTAGHLNKTADAATGTLNAAADTLGEGKRTIAAAQPLLAQLTANGASLQATTDTLNDTLKRKAVGEMLDNLAGITGHVDGMSSDLQVKLHPILNPDPCKTKGCTFNRKVMPWITEAPTLGEGSYWTAKFIQLLRGK